MSKLKQNFYEKNWIKLQTQKIFQQKSLKRLKRWNFSSSHFVFTHSLPTWLFRVWSSLWLENLIRQFLFSLLTLITFVWRLRETKRCWSIKWIFLCYQFHYQWTGLKACACVMIHPKCLSTLTQGGTFWSNTP